MSGKLGRRALGRPTARTSLLVLVGFTALLCWWVAVVGFINTGAGTVFLVLPVIPTVAMLVLARRGRGHKAKHAGIAQVPKVGPVLFPYRRSLLVLAAFTTALCWWIGIVGMVNAGGGAHMFLSVPVLATVGMVIAVLYRRMNRDSFVVRMHLRDHF
jgi:uncharacterized membrane protein YbaN (DUF454 family)